MLHRHARQSDETIGVAGAELRHFFVLEPDDFTGQIAVSPVPDTKLSDADGLDIYSGFVHVRQAGFHTVRSRASGPVRQAASPSPWRFRYL